MKQDEDACNKIMLVYNQGGTCSSSLSWNNCDHTETNKNALNLRGFLFFLSVILWYYQFLFLLEAVILMFLSMGMAKISSERTPMLIMWNRTLAARKYSLFLVLSWIYLNLVNCWLLWTWICFDLVISKR